MRKRREKLVLAAISVEKSTLSPDLRGDIDRGPGDMGPSVAHHTELVRQEESMIAVLNDLLDELLGLLGFENKTVVSADRLCHRTRMQIECGSTLPVLRS